MKTLDHSSVLGLVGVVVLVLFSARSNLALAAILVVAFLAYTLIKRRSGLGC
jgi:hypothetical protein